MMTDLEKFIELYASFGIDCKVRDTEEGAKIIELNRDRYYNPDSTLSEKFDGYSNFYSDIEFSADGKFLRQGFWE